MEARKSRPGAAVATRGRVLQAAHDLFLAQGYPRTTTREIAAAAGVTERTVFNTVASKSDLLGAVLATFVYSDEEGSLTQRADFAEVLQVESLEGFLVGFAEWVVALHQRSAAVANMLWTATPVDPVAEQLWTTGNERQVADCRDVVAVAASRGWTDPDLSQEEIADSLAVLTGHETYWRLVTRQGWSRQRYQGWLVRHCALELVGGAASTTPR